MHYVATKRIKVVYESVQHIEERLIEKAGRLAGSVPTTPFVLKYKASKIS
jgi:hypothetical protein